MEDVVPMLSQDGANGVIGYPSLSISQGGEASSVPGERERERDQVSMCGCHNDALSQRIAGLASISHQDEGIMHVWILTVLSEDRNQMANRLLSLAWPTLREFSLTWPTLRELILTLPTL